MAGFLWGAFGVAVVIVGAAAGTHAWLILLARGGASGTEFVQMVLAPLFFTAYLMTYVGAVSGLILAFTTDSLIARVLAGSIGGAMAAFDVTVHVVLYRKRRRRREINRVLSKDELLDLIKSRSVDSFRKETDGIVRFTYVNNWDENEEVIWRPCKADGAGYPAYVAAADDVRRRCGHTISYRDENNPGEPGRWITVDEAITLLQANEVNTFGYGEPWNFSDTTAKGEPTGIRLLDYGWLRHLHVSSTLEATMIPIAREAQRRHGKPQFKINGRWEYLPRT
ncbi:hypothetical protein LWC34_39550 [Kibdelosporangium philippinense]|uniref:Uncharacterized protein n=1 Tax=Kibdelosporangium philippinense TaxID=211113 RepID=A0ABS8ZM41_9PSEU|nr:hypothetical protein [Kibdelosporangium philippinense]MCE7008865.1 hypothetical protein [Kibdelosporangium philippinense]